jgi:hypothetical protein
MRLTLHVAAADARAGTRLPALVFGQVRCSMHCSPSEEPFCRPWSPRLGCECRCRARSRRIRVCSGYMSRRQVALLRDSQSMQRLRVQAICSRH